MTYRENSKPCRGPVRNHPAHGNPAPSQVPPAKFPTITIYTKGWWITTMVCTLALYFFQEDPNAAAPAAANGSALLEMIHNSGPVAFAVLVILLLASIFSWTIMISKWSRFGRAQTQSARFIRAFRKSTRLSEIAAVSDQFKPKPAGRRLQ